MSSKDINNIINEKSILNFIKKFYISIGFNDFYFEKHNSPLL